MKDDIANRILDKLDAMDARIDNIDITLAKQSVVLEDHTRRSLANEKAVDILKEELKPVVSHVNLVNTAWKIFVGAITFAMSGFGLFEYFKK